MFIYMCIDVKLQFHVLSRERTMFFFRCVVLSPFDSIIPLCKHVVAKVTLVPCSVHLTGKRDEVGHGEVTINNARIIGRAMGAIPYM